MLWSEPIPLQLQRGCKIVMVALVAVEDSKVRSPRRLNQSACILFRYCTQCSSHRHPCACHARSSACLLQLCTPATGLEPGHQRPPSRFRCAWQALTEPDVPCDRCFVGPRSVNVLDSWPCADARTWLHLYACVTGSFWFCSVDLDRASIYQPN